MIEAKNLTKIYSHGSNKIYALNNVSLKIKENEFVAIVGKSGSGKSTLLHLLGGLDNATEGSVLYDNIDLFSLKEKELNRFRRLRMGFVFQDFNLIPELTGEENIKFPNMLLKKDIPKAFYKQLIDSLDLGDSIGRLPSQMSGGQQQRIAVARAFINKPQIVLCDEPTGNLDSESGRGVVNLILDLRRKFEQTVVMVTHDIDYASMADRIIKIKDGKLDEISL